jgi:hypothetical protein
MSTPQVVGGGAATDTIAGLPRSGYRGIACTDRPWGPARGAVGAASSAADSDTYRLGFIRPDLSKVASAGGGFSPRVWLSRAHTRLRPPASRRMSRRLPGRSRPLSCRTDLVSLRSLARLDSTLTTRRSLLTPIGAAGRIERRSYKVVKAVLSVLWGERLTFRLILREKPHPCFRDTIQNMSPHTAPNTAWSNTGSRALGVR